MSEWNKLSGCWSWEERDFSKWAEARLKELLPEVSAVEESSATVLFLHGKKRAGCSFDGVTLRVAGATVKVPELSSDDCEDFELRGSAAADALAALRPRVSDALRTIVKELLEKVPTPAPTPTAK